MNDNDRVVAAVTITEESGTRVFDPTEVTEETVQDIILGLVTLQETATKSESCADDEAICGPDCLCYVGNVSAAMLEVLLSGPSKNEARLFLQEQFELSQGKPRVFH